MKFILKHKAILSYFSFSVITSGIGFLGSIVTMWFITPDQYGRVALFLSIQFVAVPLISFAADSLIAVNKSKLNQIEYEKFRCVYVTFAYFMFLFVSVILSIAFAIKIFEDSIFLMIPLYGLVRFLTNMASIEYILEENTFQYGILALSTAIGSLILTVLLLGLVSGSAHLRIGALLLADIIFLVVRYQGRMKLLLTYSIDKETFKSIALFGLPLLISVGPAWIINESDKFFVARNFNMAVVGYYAAACTIGGVMVTFNTAMINAITPKIYRVLGVDSGKSKSIVLKYVRINCVANFLFGSIFALSYGLFAEYILPDKYQNAKYIVFVIILASMGRALYAVMGLVIDYYKMTVSKLVGISVGAAATAVTCVLGIAKFGVVAAAIGVGVGYIALAIVLWLELAKKFR